MSDNYLLAIPVFNEERYVSRVIGEAKRHCRQILLIDDGSIDKTPELLQRESAVHVITHPENRGYGKSIADAFAFARRHAYEWLITMDCDEQHEPSHIPEFLAAMARNNEDVISGTRYPVGYDVDLSAPADRREINRRITAMLNRRLGLNITDAFCGFKAYRVSALRHLSITVAGYAMPMQFWVQAARADLRIRELPVPLIYHDRARHFGGVLDDPAARFKHYVEVLDAELAADAVRASRSDAHCLPCH